MLVFLFIPVLVSLPVSGGALNGGDEKVIAMCRPGVKQIKNIEHLYEKDLLCLDRIRLICVYHEDELTDYQPSFDYVKENELAWVGFEKITGKVGLADLFKENNWTGQFKKIFESTVGIIFTGGMDIPPAIYGQENNLLTEAATPVRNMYEVSFLFHLVGGNQDPSFVPFLDGKKDYPILAICLGAQTLNVAAGGTLIQDIPTEVYGLKTMEQVLKLDQDQIHSAAYLGRLNSAEKDLPPAFHRIKIKESSMFARRMAMNRSDTPFVLTSHHQAVEKLGKDLVATAVSMDERIIEALEHKKYKNVLGVQFHPEPYSLYQKGKFYKGKPGDDLEFNLRIFLRGQPSSMKLHQNLWRWFSEALK